MRESILPVRTVVTIAAITLLVTHAAVGALVWSTARPGAVAPAAEPLDVVSPGPGVADSPAPAASPSAPEPTPEPTPSTPAPSPEASPPPADPGLEGALASAGAGASSRGGGPRVTYNREVEPVRSLWSLFLPDQIVWLGAVVLLVRAVMLGWRRLR